MPSDFSIEVYRISFIAPQLFSFRFDGNFNSIDKNYRLYRNDVYYTKYNQEDSVSSQFSSSHYITFLNHEAFHYYMQSAWPEGITYSADMLSNEDLSSLYDEYKILNQIQTALLEEDVKPETLLPYAKEYVQIVENRMEQNPEYVKKELARETMEGTATYVGIQASKIAGYDFGVMYFDNIKNVPFSDLQRTIEAGSYNKQNLADRIPYETGALLCLLMDALEVPDWQETLNQQTKENPITLFSILSDFTKEL